jgi:menaquinone reductase, molybdopterin-binding-like subunit
MKRRDFLRLGAMGGAAVAVGGCGKAGTQLIRFVPEETLVPGVAVWRPSVCTQCPAGCGLQVRVIEGDAEVVRDGQFGIVKMGLAKKLEGNTQHPVNHGKLCAWGQAGLQVTYNPDRMKHPLKRVGQRGSGKFVQIGWDEALKELTAELTPLAAEKSPQSLAFLTKPFRGQRRELIGRFLSGFDNSQMVEFELFDDSVLRKANSLSFGYDQLPTFDLAGSNYVISFGADFLGTWNSPVAHAFAYGDMRQGRPGNRGKFVQVEARMSQTGGNSDEWIPIRPGTEGDLALGFAHVILNEHLASPAQAGTAGTQIDGWREGLADYSPAAVAWRTGIAPDVITRLAHEIAAHTPAVAIVGGAPLAQTNGLFAALAVNALNALLGSVMKQGGVLFTPQPSLASAQSRVQSRVIGETSSVRALAQQILSATPGPVGALLLYDTNPVFATPPQWQVKEALNAVPFIASFGSFIDETSSLADLILPDHSPLESWVDHIPESGSAQAAVSVAAPSVLPLCDTRPMPDVLLDLGHRLGGRTAKALPWKSYEDTLKAAIAPLRRAPGSIRADNDDDFWAKVKEQGGWWSSDKTIVEKTKASSSGVPVKREDAQFDGPKSDFPFHFLPYASQQLFDGRHANLPWMQEMPDVLTSAMWSSWVEINPQTAARLGISQGDLLEIASQHGKIRAPALLSPGISPDAVAMPVGQGHDDYGRYASGRGANPLKIVGPQVEPQTLSWAWAATRVNVAKAGTGALILFSGGPTEWGETVRR